MVKRTTEILNHQDVFKRILPGNSLGETIVYGNQPISLPSEHVRYQILSQGDFLREYYPSGHQIYNKEYYQDEWKKITDEDTKEVSWVLVPVERVDVPMQHVIVVKQLTHLCGNPIEIKFSGIKALKKDKNNLYEIKQGWNDKNMDTAFFELAKSVKITGNGAFCTYINKGKFGWRVFSFLNGDVLYRKRNDITGEVELFGRKYTQLDPDGKELNEYLNIWDEQYIYTYRMAKSGAEGVKVKLKQIFGLDGWELVSQNIHGFDSVPIVYVHDPSGPCWSFSQGNIEKLEISISRLREVNKTKAFPTLVITANQVKLQRGNMNKPVSLIKINDPDGDAKILEGGKVSDSFTLEIEKLFKFILMGSFIVLPPEDRSGDESGASVKIKYSPAIELATSDVNFFNKPVDDMLKLFKHGYGIEKGKATKYINLDARASIRLYIHQNEAEYIDMLYKAVTGKFVSVETASERSGLGENDEMERLVAQSESELTAKKTVEKFDNENKPLNNNSKNEQDGQQKSSDE